MEEIEKELVFKRFGQEKQEQIRQLVSYCTLLDLDGKDLVSIGNRLNRIKENNELKKNFAIASEYLKNCKFHYRGQVLDWDPKKGYHIFEYTDHEGASWDFNSEYFWSCRVKSMKTGKQKNFSLSNLYKPSLANSGVINILLNVHYGNIKLDF